MTLIIYHIILKSSLDRIIFEIERSEKSETSESTFDDATINDMKSSKNPKEILEELKQNIKGKKLEIALITLGACDKIECNLTWITYIYKLLLKEDGFMSLADFQGKINSLETSLQK